jgi:hypothetical protein
MWIGINMSKHTIEIEIPDGKFCHNFDKHVWCNFAVFSDNLDCWQCVLIVNIYKTVSDSLLTYKDGYSPDNYKLLDNGVKLTGNILIKKNNLCPSLTINRG